MRTTLLLLLAACSGGTETDTEPTGTTATDTESQATETDTEPGVEDGLGYIDGNLTFSGEAVSGSESWVLVADEGAGDIVCQIDVSVAGDEALTDCDECDWAFSVTLSEPTVTTDVDGACAGAGMDSAAIEALDGEVRGYGYNPEHFGHAKVLMVLEGDTWVAEANATYEDGVLDYLWDLGFLPYAR